MRNLNKDKTPEPDDGQRRKWMAERLQHSIRALASPIENQLKLFAPFECPACELLLTFDDDIDPFIQLSPDLSPTERTALTELRRKLGSLPKLECERTGPRIELEREHWTAIRASARAVLEAFGWPVEPPPPPVETSPGVWSRG